MSIHRTARGREFNMQAFASSQGDTIAVGNSGRNARGDLLGPKGQVIADADIIDQGVKATPTGNSKKVKIHPSEYEVSRKEVIGADGVSRWEVMFADGSVEIQENLDSNPVKHNSFDREPNVGDL